MNECSSCNIDRAHHDTQNIALGLIQTTIEKQEQVGILCPVLGSAWLLLSLTTVIKLPVILLAPFPNKREITLLLTVFTPHISFLSEHGLS